MVLRPSDSALRKYLPSGLSFVNATVLRGAVTMRVTISGGLVYFSFARTSLGFHPCCMTSCANIGRAARARPTAPSNTGRSVGEKRVIADSRRDDYGGRAYQRVYGMRWVGVGRKTGARNQGPGSGNDVFPTLAPALQPLQAVLSERLVSAWYYGGQPSRRPTLSTMSQHAGTEGLKATADGAVQNRVTHADDDTAKDGGIHEVVRDDVLAEGARELVRDELAVAVVR